MHWLWKGIFCHFSYPCHTLCQCLSLSNTTIQSSSILYLTTHYVSKLYYKTWVFSTSPWWPNHLSLVLKALILKCFKLNYSSIFMDLSDKSLLVLFHLILSESGLFIPSNRLFFFTSLNCCCCLVVKLCLIFFFPCLTLLRPHGLYPARLLCPRDFPGKNGKSGLPFPSQGDLPDPGIEPRSLMLLYTCFPWNLISTVLSH